MTVEHVASGLFDRRRVRVPMARFCPVRSRLLPPPERPPPHQAAASRVSDYTTPT
jgi:hypothetical protein